MPTKPKAMICIDFGNTYTKVGIRSKTDSTSELVQDASLQFDEGLNICIPTVAARIKKNGQEKWFFGNDVLGVAQSPGLETFRNWKPLFFKGEETNLRDMEPLPVAANGTSKRSMTTDEWNAVKKVLNLQEDARLLIEQVLSSQNATPPPAAAHETELDIKLIGLGFFRWLREFVDPVCQKRGLGPIAKIPARITLASFGSAAKSELLLKELLEEAGWKIDRKAGTLSEPRANAIGTFTEGVNATHRPKGASQVMPDYGQMFEQTGLLQVIREAILADGPTVSWTLIADLGGYTLDFAMVPLNLRDIDAQFESAIDGSPSAKTHSEAVGVTTLDRRVRELLTPEKKKVLDALIKEADQKRLESCHRILYGKRRGVKFRNLTIGVDNAEHRQICRCIDEFAEEIADCAEKFMEINQYGQIDDLVLTGGGMMIPTIRETIIRRLDASFGVRKIHMHSSEEIPTTAKNHGMNQKLVRGATALGGASVFFDYAD